MIKLKLQFFCHLIIIANLSRTHETSTTLESSTWETTSELTTWETTTEDPNNFSCPFNFTEFNDKCYIISASCPFTFPLSFAQIYDIASNLSETIKLEITKNNKYDYFQWIEPLGEYGKLFAENLTIINQTGDSIIADFYTTNLTYYLTNEPYDFVCAYHSFLAQPSKTYCNLYDDICGKNLDATNCHCFNITGQHFCELNCEKLKYNETICSQCEGIIAAYKNPEISLQMNFDKNFIYVSITWFQKLIPLDSTGKSIFYCYTDANNTLHDISFRYDVNTDSTYKTYKQIHYKIEPLEDSIGHYWCKAFDFDENYIDSDMIIAENGKRQSLTMNITVIDEEENYPLTIHETTQMKIIDILDNSRIEEVKFLHLYEKNSTSRIISYRLYFTNGSMTDVLNEMNETFSENATFSPSYCLPDITTLKNKIKLTWNDTLLGMTTIPNELCLQQNSKPVTRQCIGEYLYGTFWAEVKGSCVQNSGKLYGSSKTVELHTLLHSSDSSTVKLPKLKEIIKSGFNPIPIDIHFMSLIIENIILSDGSYNINDLIEVLSDLMDFKREVLQEAQILLNSTDTLLYNLQRALAKYTFIERSKIEYFQIHKNNIYVQVSKLDINITITGAAVFKNDTFVIITNDTNSNFENLKIAAFITNKELEQIIDLKNNLSRLIITFFKKDSFFNQKKIPTTTGYLVGVHISGFEEPFLKDCVKIYIKPDRKYRADLFWNQWKYGRDKLWYNRKSGWKNLSQVELQDNLAYYESWNWGFIAILVGDEGDVVLSIITVIGCVLSMFGGLAVIITGIVYRSWREKSGTKILLNFVLTNMTQNIVLGFSSKIDSYKEEDLCILIGACLHYCVLSQFTWMLIIGYLQYMRYVKIYYTVDTCFVLMSSIIAWMLPIIPVIITLSIKTQYYVQDDFCYLQDQPLFYGVFLPVALTLMINFIIFIIIIINIYCRSDMLAMKDNITWLNLRLIILLFFLLGLYWVFGITARFTHFIVFDYFFCISAALQGVVIFLYFIVFNKMTKNFWLRQLKLSEMVSVMQIWMQQRKKIGRIRINKEKSKTNVRILKSLEQKLI